MRAEADALIRAARAGEPDALGNLLELYRNYLRFVAGGALDGALAAKAGTSDVVQETLVKAHARFDQFRGTSEGEVIIWLKQILSRNLADLHRRFVASGRRALAREQSLDTLLDRSSTALAGLLPANGTSPSQGAARRERAVMLADALARLRPEDREVIVLRNLRELEWNEVAARTGRSADAVRMQWSRALRLLGAILESTT